jgi:twitching motility protein PilT
MSNDESRGSPVTVKESFGDPSGICIAEILGVVDSSEIFSDMIVVADEPVMVRNASGWVRLDVAPYPKSTVEYILTEMDPAFGDLLNEGGFSRSFLIGSWRLRINAYLSHRGKRTVLAIRRTPVVPKTLEEANLPPSIKTMVDNLKGLVLISGATGSGKTTTMAALIDKINSSRNCHIETIEDPIEYYFEPKKSIFSQREVGKGADTPSFFEGVHGAMRQRPDVIVIGEIRDRDTAENAILAAESGHLVIATIHASSAHGAVTKLASFFPGEDKITALASSLVGVIYQNMLPGIDQKTGVVACELIFNHHQNFSENLGDANRVAAQLENPTDGISRSMAKALAELVQQKRVTKANAIISVSSQAMVRKKLDALLQALPSA